MDASSRKPFKEAAGRAFPLGMVSLAHEAALELSPFIDDNYRLRSEAIAVNGQMVAIPQRLHFIGLSAETAGLSNLNLASRCLITRATDGRLRQQAVRSIIKHQNAWVAPFVLLLFGDYIIEIVREVSDALQGLDQSVDAKLIRENPQTLQRLRGRATSYWDAYYRQEYPQKRDFTGLQALNEMETWAE